MADDLGLAMQYMRENKSRDAESLLNRILKQDPNNLNALQMLGIVHLRSGKLDQAEQLMRKAVQTDPDLQFAHNNLGEVYRVQGRLELAAASFGKALAIDPDFSDAHANLGLVMQQQGMLQEAVSSYRRALSLSPNDLETHQHLAGALFALGRMEDTEASLRAIVALNPRIAGTHNNLGLVLKRLGRPEDAVSAFQKALEIEPDFADAYYNLGVTLDDLGQLDEAVGRFRAAITRNPGFAEAHYNLGVVLEKLERVDDAVEAYKTALAIRPRFPEAHNNLGILLKEAGQLEEAAAHYRKAIGAKPDYAEAHNNLGLALLASRSLDEAHRHFRKAVEIDGRYAMAHLNLGVVLSELRRMNEAASHYRKAIDLDPQLPVAHNNLGNVLQELGQMDDAISCFRKAIEVRPEFAEAYSNLGNAQKELGRIEEAIVHYRKAIELKPDYAEAHSNLLLALHYGECPAQDVYNEHKAWNARHAEHLQALDPGRGEHPDPDKALHVGFVSPDFREHSVAYFLRSFFAARDTQKLVFSCYSNTRHEDAMTEDLRASVDEWRNIAGRDDRSVAEAIRDDGVDILVDLSGHTRDNRLPLFALRPAPIQATWLGYPDTTGLAAMDYRITDAVADPLGEADDRNVEQLIRLPDGFLCYCPPDDAPDVGSAPGAAKGTVTFASFNNQTKVTPEVVKAWARILQAVPGSELLMKCQSFDSSEVRDRYQGLFEQEAVASDRLRLVGRSPSTAEHLAMYGQADIALDPFPYNGTTTTCEALWMGVPVVALRGDRHAARVGASLLAQVGLDSLVAKDAGQYVDKAVSLAGDLQRIESLRAEMRSRMQKSPLCDADKFAENMEVAFRSMWNEYCARRSG